MSNWRAIGQGCGAQTVIFASSMLSAAVICPALGKFQDCIISVLIALGAGCLAGDSIFHLMPHALNPHHHHEQGGETTDSDGHVIWWRSMLIVISVYLFYLFHIFFHSTQGGHAHSHIGLPVAGEDKQLLPAGDEPPPAKNNKAVMWMMMVGELLHTASDGLAIGAAFSSSAGDGLSTSLAVLFHEIPHAVGAFAIFLSSGVPVCRALFLLTVCYLFSYMGVVIGAILGATFNLAAWVFAVIAGMFLYISLAEMLPEMFEAVSSATHNRPCIIFLQNLGLLLGFTIMAILAAFEEKIRHFLQ